MASYILKMRVRKKFFFNYVKDHPFRESRGKILNFNRARTKPVHNKDEDVSYFLVDNNIILRCLLY